MKTRDMLLLLGSFVLMVVLSSSGFAEAETVTGMVTDVTEDGFILTTGEKTLRTVIPEKTACSTEDSLENGDVVMVRTERSIQDGILYADGIVKHKIRGIIEEVVEGEEPYLLLTPYDGNDVLRVNMGDIPMTYAAAGIPVAVYSDGKMTRSIPPQITALYIRGLILNGTITEIRENGDLMMLTDQKETVIVRLTEKTLMLTSPEIGKAVSVSVLPQMRLSMPPQYEAQDVLPMKQ